MTAPAGVAAPRPEPVGGAVADPSRPLVVVEGLSFRFGRRTVLEGVGFDVGRGVTGLLGANGSGKTTLFTLLLGLRRPAAGAVRVFGKDPVSTGPEVRSRIGFAPEHHHLPADVPAHEFVRHLAEVHGLPRRVARERSSDALWWVGLGEERFRPLGTLSVGQRQRVKLAMAIAHDPLLVILDEPTDGLDPNQRDAMLALIRRVGGEFGISVLLSSHLLEEVERTCDRVLMLAEGRIARAGAVAELRGEGHGLRIDVERGADELARCLAARGHLARAEGTRVVVDAAPGGRDDPAAIARDARDAIAELGLGVRRLQPRVATLEDVFLEVGR